MAIMKILQKISSPKELALSISTNHFMIVAVAVLAILYFVSKRKVAIYLLDFACYQPPDSCRLPKSMFVEHIFLDNSFDSDCVAFKTKIMEKSGFSEETSIPPSQSYLPIRKSISFDFEEATTVIFSTVTELLKKNKINPKTIDILISNSSLFCPTPSLSAMVVNKFKMRSNIMSFNLSGMGCSAGVLSVALAQDLLRVHRNSLALIVSTEILHPNWYTGKNRSMLLTNCLFRMGGAAILMSSRDQDNKAAKYELKHLVRTNKAQNQNSYACVFQDVDSENNVGVCISKDIINVAGDALKANIATLGPLVLPFSEQFRYGLSPGIANPWREIIHSYPVDVPDVVKLD
ncbi:hypothetical protein L1049_017146 [Liquidambar formosana]|uniref:FAE domain-containing protein n=1 Tax=Liquidambar formosana TaxID=63359 RepID=A0AAP0X786_LIQFO